MKSGAVDFLQKPFGYSDLLDAIHRALDQGRPVREFELGWASLEKRPATLTKRECQVFTLVVTGMPNKQVADQVGTAEKTSRYTGRE